LPEKTASSLIASPPGSQAMTSEKCMNTLGNSKRSGFSLMELLAVVTILGIIAAIIVPRVAVSSDTAKSKVNAHNKGTINAAVERWYIEKGTWPANNLSDIGADGNYFPEGVPTNPTNGAAYTLNATTHRVN
jgi:prepilin-type N-terminal cleavage/methylation domain-containing protein